MQEMRMLTRSTTVSSKVAMVVGINHTSMNFGQSPEKGTTRLRRWRALSFDSSLENDQHNQTLLLDHSVDAGVVSIDG
jgi:hypothetical protein